MLTVVSATMWRSTRAGCHLLSLPLERGTHRLALAARAWAGMERLVKVEGNNHGNVELIGVGELMVGVFDLADRNGGTLTVECDRMPGSLALRTSHRPHGKTLCASVMPASLIGYRPEVSTVRPVDLEWIEAKLQAGDPAAAIDEVAVARLSGLNVQEAATILLRYLAARPLYRSNLLGALMAALGDHRGTI